MDILKELAAQVPAAIAVVVVCALFLKAGRALQDAHMARMEKLGAECHRVQESVAQHQKEEVGRICDTFERSVTSLVTLAQSKQHA